MTLKRTVLVVAFAWLQGASTLADTFGTGVNAFQIEFVSITTPGTIVAPYGQYASPLSLSEGYRIGKFEIPRDAILRANAEASLSIPLSDPSHFPWTGLTLPATVDWFGAAKFVNWLNVSTGNHAAYKFDAAGSFQLWTPSDAGYDPSNLYRNTLAHYFLPSRYEWHRAAFYDPNHDVHYNYATGSNVLPIPVANGTAATPPSTRNLSPRT